MQNERLKIPAKLKNLLIKKHFNAPFFKQKSVPNSDQNFLCWRSLIYDWSAPVYSNLGQKHSV